MRIALITEATPSSTQDGAGDGWSVERTQQHLRAAGHVVHLLCPHPPRRAPLQSVVEWELASGSLPACPRGTWARAGDLRRHWRSGPGNAPDRVHVTSAGPWAWAALRAARAEGIATSAELRTDFDAEPRHCGGRWLETLRLMYRKRLHAMADINFVPTESLATKLGKLGFGSLHVLGSGVDAERFSPIWRDVWLRHRWHTSDRDPVMLVVVRKSDRQGLHLALEAFEHFRELRQGLRMVVLGDGPLLRQMAQTNPRVCFAGAVSGTDLLRHYASADLLLATNPNETFGDTTLEAMACGLAVVAFDTGAAGLHIRHGENGWLVPKPDPASGRSGSRDAFLAATWRALQQWRPDSSVRQNARATAQTLGWNRVLSEFEQCLGREAARPPLAAVWSVAT